MYYRTYLFRTTLWKLHLVHRLSAPKLFFRCEIWCKVWSCSTKINKISISRCKSLEIRVLYGKLRSRKQGNSTEFLLNTTAIRKAKLNCIWLLCLKLCCERNTELRAITTPSYKQHEHSELQNSKLNLLTWTFLATENWTEVNLRWLIIRGSVKREKIDDHR